MCLQGKTLATQVIAKMQENLREVLAVKVMALSQSSLLVDLLPSPSFSDSWRTSLI